ncbi:MAG TPA: hypothetical protein DDW26_05210 [Rhizobiales bacterium]|jgi:hypothetical protein|nr:hypothetical protein [Hyphomicrobiales bacterium]
MVSPMREKRAWPPRDKDADGGESVAAFEATVAEVKQTVVRSGEVLFSAKEDLNDHQRWLEVQNAAVEADRARHDRWLQRQRERQEAIERREQAKRRRQAMRQRAVQSVKDAVSAVAAFVASLFWLVVGRIVAAFSYVGGLIASGAAWVGAQLRYGALLVAVAVQRALLWTGQKARTAALAIGALLSAGFFVVAAKTSELAGAAGRLLSAASSSLGAKTTALAGASGRALSAGLSQVSAKIHTLTPQIGRFLAICFSGIAARVGDLSRSTGRLLAIGFAALAVKADAFARSTGRLLAPHFAWICAKAYALAPSLAERVAKAGLITAHFARKGAGRVQTLLATATAARFRTPRAETQLTEVSLAEAPLAEGKNEVSSPTRIGGFALSQMLIIAGALFLVCGGLMLGGGLILRAGTPAPVATSDGIVWFFEQKGLPIAERSVFTFAGTSEGVRVTGFSISGENQSDQPMTSVAGLIKPDGDRPELTLAVSVDMPGGEASVVHPPEVHVAEPLAGGVIPPHARFKLAFPFPVEAANGEHGVTAEEVLATFGGLMLTVHYDYEGKQKAFMLYLSPSMLKDQLAEIQAEPNG